MRRIRQWLLAGVVAAFLTLSFGSLASADPGDPGHFSQSSSKSSWSSSSYDPGDPGH